jgi:serine/threonine-protein kinase HipA
MVGEALGRAAVADERGLIVVIGGRRAGVISMSTQGHLALRYDDEWLATRNPTPLSLSMPLAQGEHGDVPVRAFLWGLLPDNEQVLQRWARTYHVSAGNPFALLRHVGEDCAGAAQFVRPKRTEAQISGQGGVQWLEEDEVAERLRVLRRDPTAWHVHAVGQFSLAGAQAKTALHRDPTTGRWGESHGAIPTTHILKPAVSRLDDHDLNEHVCLYAAGLLGLPAASSFIGSLSDERVVVVERYERIALPDGITARIHQEDMCQTLGLPPTTKYQNEGGPTPEQIIAVLRDNVRPSTARVEAVNRFVDALAINWIIGGTDAHAKNYSVLLSGSQVRLAPLYDVASALAYDDMYVPRLRMAMKIGGEYGIEATTGYHGRRFAQANKLDPGEIVARIDNLAERTGDAFVTAAKDKTIRALKSQLPARLADRIAARAMQCRKKLEC